MTKSRLSIVLVVVVSCCRCTRIVWVNPFLRATAVQAGTAESAY